MNFFPTKTVGYRIFFFRNIFITQKALNSFKQVFFFFFSFFFPWLIWCFQWSDSLLPPLLQPPATAWKTYKSVVFLSLDGIWRMPLSAVSQFTSYSSSFCGLGYSPVNYQTYLLPFLTQSGESWTHGVCVVPLFTALLQDLAHGEYLIKGQSVC